MIDVKHKAGGVTIFIIALIAFGFNAAFLVQPANAVSVSPWGSTTSYPTPTASHSCAIFSNFIYCVGGNTASGPTNAVNFAPVSSAGVGTWSSTTSYPTPTASPSCVIFSRFIYCVGGQTASGRTSAVNFAPVSSAGVGTWSSTTSYPLSLFLESCTIFSNFIYCVGGSTSTTHTSAVYFASVSSTGVGTWTLTTSYPTPIASHSCAIFSNFLYCVGGVLPPPSFTRTSAVYFASVSSTGVGTWTLTTSYPTTIHDQSCVIFSGFIYCVGGGTESPFSTPVLTSAVNFAPVSSAGVGTWSSTTSYPTPTYAHSCAIFSHFIYCVGGVTGSGSTFTSAVYFAQIASSD